MRLPAWHRWLLISILAGVGLSGLLWFVLHDLVRLEPGPTLHAVLIAHGVTAYLSTIGIGSLLPKHVWIGLRQPKNRVSGLLSLASMASLVGSALFLYYGDENIQSWMRPLHLTVGLMATGAVSLHVSLAWRR